MGAREEAREGGAKRRREVQDVCVCERERVGVTVREEKGKNRKTFYVYQCRKYVYSSSAKM